MYDGSGVDKDEQGFNVPQHVISLHKASVVQMKFNEIYDTCLSIDARGMVEYWSPAEQFGLPRAITFQFKTETDLYHFAKVSQ